MHKIIIEDNDKQYTCFPKNPPLIEAVNKKDGRLCDGHHEVADGQVHDEEVGRCPEFLVAERHQA